MNLLSAFPSGLLDLVGAQNFGVNPKELSQIVSPIVDLTELYLVSKIASPAGTNPAGANGFNQLGAAADPFLVPIGEVWRVFAFSVTAFVTAAGGATYSPAVLINGSRIQLTVPRTQAVLGTSDWNVMTAAPFYTPAGSRLGIEAQQVTGTITFGGQALVSRLRA